MVMRSAREYAMDFFNSRPKQIPDVGPTLECLFKKAQAEAYEAGQRDMRSMAYNLALDKCVENTPKNEILIGIYELPIKPYGESSGNPR